MTIGGNYSEYGASQAGTSRLNSQGVGGLGSGQNIGGGTGGSGRNLNNLASLNLAANGVRGSAVMGPPIGGMAVQAFLRNVAPLQQGLGINQAAYVQGGEFSNLTSRGTFSGSSGISDDVASPAPWPGM